MEISAAVAANLLLAATIIVFMLLTFIAFLLNEGKPIVVEPLKRRLYEKYGIGKGVVAEEEETEDEEPVEEKA